MGSPQNDSTLKGVNAEGDVPRRTTGEIAREKRLRNDPMAEVNGPLFVTCKRCGNRIKLSPKSLYDPFHWLKHRERCLKKPVGGIRATKRPARAISTPEKHSPTSSYNTDTENLTPPPSTPNDDQRESPTVFKEESASPEPNKPIVDSLTKITASVLIDQGPWQSWSWSDLKRPAWLIDANNNMFEDDSDDYDEPPRVTIIECDSTPTLSFHPITLTQDHS